MPSDSHEELIRDITPDVMTCLERVCFFDKLDDLLCPVDPSALPAQCRCDYALSQSILRDCGFRASDLDDIFDVLKSQGGFCDCEILYNAVETSRLKAQYWRSQAHKSDPAPGK